MAAPPDGPLPQKQQPELTRASRALIETRRLARLQIQHVAAAIGLSTRTVSRWEKGLCRPSVKQWSKVIAYLARFVPDEAVALAQVAGVPSPISQAPEVDLRALEDALLRTADDLDLSPRRVRAAVRELVKATRKAHGTLTDLERASQEKERPLDLETEHPLG